MSVDTSPAPESTDLETPAAAVVDRMRAGFESGRTRSWEWREAQLRGLLKMMKEHESEFLDAVSSRPEQAEVRGMGGRARRHLPRGQAPDQAHALLGRAGAHQGAVCWCGPARP